MFVESKICSLSPLSGIEGSSFEALLYSAPVDGSIIPSSGFTMCWGVISTSSELWLPSVIGLFPRKNFVSTSS